MAYWFKHDFERICKRLQKLHTPFSKLDTDESIKRWNNARQSCLLRQCAELLLCFRSDLAAIISHSSAENERLKYEQMKAELVLQTSDGEITAANAAALSNKLSVGDFFIYPLFGKG